MAGFSYSKRKSHYDSTVCGSGSSGPVVVRRLYGNVSMKEQAMNSRTHQIPRSNVAGADIIRRGLIQL